MECIALIPAAGSGQRLGGSIPKQYHLLRGTPMLVHTIWAMQARADIQHVFVILSPDDTLFAELCIPHLQHCTPLYVGAQTRAGSVLNGLRALPSACVNTWVCVHDAARPCLHSEDLSNLLDTLKNTTDHDGYVLANPVADTLKRTHKNTNQVLETVSRETLWQAQTPQIARRTTLLNALTQALETTSHTLAPTDEAQALEWAGCSVQLVAARHPNFKVTYPADQRLAEAVLAQIEHANPVHSP